MKKTIRYDLCLKPTSFEKISDQFTKCKCYVLGLGKNRNLSYISRQSVDRALYSLGYCPVVAHLMYDEENNKWYIGGHDRELNSDCMFEDVTVPYGVVISDSFGYEDVIEKSGSVVTYLTCDVILWTGRYPDLMKAAYGDDVYFGQSMEIIPISTAPYSEDKKYTDIKEFVFSCLTLLGKSDDPEYHVEPCFPEAKVEAFSAGFNDLYNEMKHAIAEINDHYKLMIDQITKLNKKEEEILNEKIALVEKYNLSVDALDFSIEELSLEDLESKLVDFSQKCAQNQKTEKRKDDFALNLMEYIKKIEIQISQEQIVDEYYGWSYPRYWLVDVQDDEVIVQDGSDHYNYYGFALKVDGDNVTVDFACKKRKKCKYSDFESGDQSIVFKNESVIASAKCAFDKIDADKKAAEAELAEMKSSYSEMQANLNAANEKITEYEAQIKSEKDAAEASARKSIFDRFDPELSGMEEYEAMKDSDLLADAIEKECYALIGKKKFDPVPAKKASATKFSFIQSSDATVPYNGLFEKYKKN